MNAVKSPIKWIGGKSALAKWILPFFPDHKIYIEPFVGGCNVIAQKDPTYSEIVNDLNGELVHFLMFIKDDDNLNKLIYELEHRPYSRELFNKYKWEPLPEDPLELAVRFFYKVRSAFNGGGSKYKLGWSTPVKDVNKRNSYMKSLGELKAFQQRMLEVHIENNDFEQVINQYDCPEALHYIDPPYLGKEAMYAGGFSFEDHQRLANCLHQIKGKVIISYYHEEEILKLYPGWHVEYKETSTNFHNHRPDLDNKRTEMLLMNFKPEVQLTLEDMYEHV